MAENENERTEPTQPVRGRPSPETLPWEAPFLAAFKNSANVRAACEAAGISRERAYHRKRINREFREKWERAQADAVDALEAVAWKRARDGLSDTLLIFLLKAHRPERYAERLRIDFVRSEAARLAEGSGMTPGQLIAEAERILREVGP